MGGIRLFILKGLPKDIAMSRRPKFSVFKLGKTANKKAKTILSFDPGTKNFAYSIIKNGKCKEIGFLNPTVNDLKNELFMLLVRKFLRQIKRLVQKHKPDFVIAERYMVRGRFNGAQAECVNVMLGLIAFICQKLRIHFQLITAAVWKNQFHRDIGPKSLVTHYKMVKKMPPHVMDATFIGLYAKEAKYTKKSIKRNMTILEELWTTSAQP